MNTIQFIIIDDKLISWIKACDYLKLRFPVFLLTFNRFSFPWLLPGHTNFGIKLYENVQTISLVALKCYCIFVIRRNILKQTWDLWTVLEWKRLQFATRKSYSLKQCIVHLTAVTESDVFKPRCQKLVCYEWHPVCCKHVVVTQQFQQKLVVIFAQERPYSIYIFQVISNTELAQVHERFRHVGRNKGRNMNKPATTTPTSSFFHLGESVQFPTD